MIFSSVTFLYYFLPVVLTLYFIAPKKLKNTVLLISSLVFYGWGEPGYLILMSASILIGYIFGILIEKAKSDMTRKAYLFISSAFFIGALGYFKYADFFIVNFNRITGLSVGLLKLLLPIGISFYTFQILSYVIDVYRKDVPAQKNIINLGAYISLFPQLIAGPIVRYSDIERQLNSREHSFEKTAYGIRRFIIGLSKKVIIANSLGELCRAFTTSSDKSVAFYWLFAVAYSMQIYFDFSGYSDMAIGLGKILGFDFLENFNYPYISKSITDFWRRWHISLGSWFKDYVYIPLGGNRVSKGRMLLNIFAVWFLTGFWHGAEWNFIVWGLYFGILLTVEKFFYKEKIEKCRILSHLYVLFFVVISFVIFSADNMTGAIKILGGMFGFENVPIISKEFVYYMKSYGVILILGAVFSTPALKKAAKCIEGKALGVLCDILEIPVLAALFITVTGFLADGSFNPFLYFRF